MEFSFLYRGNETYQLLIDKYRKMDRFVRLMEGFYIIVRKGNIIDSSRKYEELFLAKYDCIHLFMKYLEETYMK